MSQVVTETVEHEARPTLGDELARQIVEPQQPQVQRGRRPTWDKAVFLRAIHDLTEGHNPKVEYTTNGSIMELLGVPHSTPQGLQNRNRIKSLVKAKLVNQWVEKIGKGQRYYFKLSGLGVEVLEGSTMSIV